MFWLAGRQGSKRMCLAPVRDRGGTTPSCEPEPFQTEFVPRVSRLGGATTDPDGGHPDVASTLLYGCGTYLLLKVIRVLAQTGAGSSHVWSLRTV